MNKLFVTALTLIMVGTSHLVAMEPSTNVAELDQLKKQVYLKLSAGVSRTTREGPKVLLSYIQEITKSDQYKDMQDTDLSEALCKALEGNNNVKIVDIKGYFLDTVLHYACRFGYLRSTVIILGATDNQKQRDELLMMQDDAYMTALHEAVRGRHVEIVMILVSAISKSKRADFITIKNCPDKVTFWALTESIKINPAGISGLAQPLADCKRKENDGCTALEYARRQGNTEIVNILEDALQSNINEDF